MKKVSSKDYNDCYNSTSVISPGYLKPVTKRVIHKEERHG